ncbi:MAG: HAD-IA family hydrolase [Rhodocyclaceae bacterium]|nr:HAD-IA family hydrolase [Rhodocyclaceae bacterium]
MTLEAVIFDVDGTLADTEEAHRQAFNATFRDFCLPWEWDAPLYRNLLAVTGGKERMRHYCERFHPDFLAIPEADEFIARMHKAKTVRYGQMVMRGGVAARPGVVRLIRELRAAGIRLAIATTTSRSNVDALLATTLQALPPDTFEGIGAAEQAADKKPSPAIYRWVLERLALSPDECIAIEDSRNGVQAAQAAGIPTLVTECGWTAGENFSGALAVLSDLGEPDRPYVAIGGAAVDAGCVDPELLRHWHAQTTPPTA